MENFLLRQPQISVFVLREGKAFEKQKLEIALNQPQNEKHERIFKLSKGKRNFPAVGFVVQNAGRA